MGPLLWGRASVICREVFQVSCPDCVFLPVLNLGSSGEPFRTLTSGLLHRVSGVNLTVGKTSFLSSA